MSDSIQSIGTCLKKSHRVTTMHFNHHPRQIHKLAERSVARIKRRVVREVKAGRMIPIERRIVDEWTL